MRSIKLRSFSERCKFSTRLTRIAINNTLMLLRRRKRRSELSFDVEIEETHRNIPRLVDNTIDPEQSLIRQESIKIIRKAVRALPRTLRDDVELHRLRELPPREAVASLGISLQAGKAVHFVPTSNQEGH
jgi:RNA polymerase sigma-70 factor, ECF subfamily